MDILRETKKDYLAAERLVEAIQDYIDQFGAAIGMYQLYGEAVFRQRKADAELKKLMEKGE